MDLRARILVVLGASSISVVGAGACGSDSTVVQTPSDAQADGAPSSDAAAEASGSVDANDAATSPSDATTSDVIPTPRRPFLVGAELRMASARDREDWLEWASRDAGAIDDKTRAMLREAWLEDARQEHASIAAFARLSLHMLSVGAPPELVAGAHRAALDETRHAKACFALASRYAKRSLGPGALEIGDALGAMSLEQIAALAVEEGCVGETLGVVAAEAQLARAKDPEVVALLRKLVIDEARHAELAWSFARWALRVGGEPVRRAMERAFDRALAAVRATPIRAYEVDEAAWHAHGRLFCKEAREETERGIAQILTPCREALLATRTEAHAHA